MWMRRGKLLSLLSICWRRHSSFVPAAGVVIKETFDHKMFMCSFICLPFLANVGSKTFGGNNWKSLGTVWGIKTSSLLVSVHS